MSMGSHEKAQQYAKDKYLTDVNVIRERCRKELAQTQANLSANGLSRSGAWESAIASNLAQQIRLSVQARVDGLLDAYELYEIPIDDKIAQEIISEAQRLCSSLVSQTKNAAAQGLAGMGRGGSIILSRELEIVSVPVGKIRCQIEERRIRPRMTQDKSGVTNVYHVTGVNSRVNVNSTDRSVNVVYSSEQVFTQMREQLTAHVPREEQGEILARLNALERAQGNPSFAQRYTEFVGAAADHITLLAPFIPALTEMLRNALG